MKIEYENEVLIKIELFNSILNELGVSSLYENCDFEIDEQFHEKHYVKFVLHKTNTVKLDLIFMYNAMQINIDKTNETLEWSNMQITENKAEIIDILKILFVSNIIIEYCGSNYTKISFYNSERKCVKTLKYVTGIYLKIGCLKKEYPPIYVY